MMIMGTLVVVPVTIILELENGLVRIVRLITTELQKKFQKSKTGQSEGNANTI